MREIKFRGKRLDNGEWVYGSLVSIHDTAIIVEDCDFSWNPDTDITAFWFDKKENEVDPATVGQYTGLKDKNGREIYEGDICQYEYTSLYDGQNKRPNKPFTVAWNSQEACFCGWDGFDYSSMPNVNRMVVIGNIHDNPELLKFDITT